MTARIEQVAQRARDDAIRMAADADEPVEMGPIHLFHAVLMHDKGPGAEALRSVGVDPRRARTALGLPEPKPVHIFPALWPPPRYTREFFEPRDISEAVGNGRQLPQPALPHAPDPSPEAEPSAFVWTSEGQQLEMWAAPGGPIHLRISPGGTLEVSAEAAELVCRMLTGFFHQLQAERWEPIYEAERLGRPKPPLPPDPA